MEVNNMALMERKEKLWRMFFAVGILLMMLSMTTVTVHAGNKSKTDTTTTTTDDASETGSSSSSNSFFTNVKSAVNSVYDDVKTVATPIAGLSFVVAMLFSIFSHNQKSVDMSRQTAKGILISWIVLMLAGPIFNYADTLIKTFGTSSIFS